MAICASARTKAVPIVLISAELIKLNAEVLPSLLINVYVGTQNGFEYLRTRIESHSIIFYPSRRREEEKC